MTRDHPRREGAKGRQRREDIVNAAEQLFVTRGYDSTTIQDIADAAGILKGSIYYYVTSKQELLFHVVLRNHRRLHGYVLDDPAYAELPPLDAVRRFIERHVVFVLDHHAVSALYSAEIEVVRTVDAWWAAIAEERREHEAALVTLIEAAESSDRSSPGATPRDAALSARALLAMANGPIRWYHADGRYRTKDVAAHHAALAVRALGADG